MVLHASMSRMFSIAVITTVLARAANVAPLGTLTDPATIQSFFPTD
jgi:hypothetical protein